MTADEINACYAKLKHAADLFTDACIRLQDTTVAKAELLKAIEELDSACVKHRNKMTE